MDKFNKGNKVTMQGVSESPSPVGMSSGVPGSTRRSSGDWTNGVGKVGSRASPRSIYMTGDQIEGKVNAAKVGAAKEVASGKTAAKKYYEFDEDISEIMEEVEMSTPTRKEKEDNVKAAKIIKEEPIKGNKIIKYFKKGMEEGKVFKPTRSLARSPIKARKQEIGNISEVDTTTELSDSGRERIT
jgi:hypothetical protein